MKSAQRKREHFRWYAFDFLESGMSSEIDSHGLIGKK